MIVVASVGCRFRSPVCIVVVIHYTPGSPYLLAQDSVKGSRAAIQILEDWVTEEWGAAVC